MLPMHTAGLGKIKSNIASGLGRLASSVHTRVWAVFALALLSAALTLPLQRELLASLSPHLQDLGVNVRYEWTSAATRPPVSPTLAPLRGFPTSTTAASRLSSSFGELFQAGAFHEAALLAAEADPSRPRPRPSGFLEYWERTPAEKRVFVSFTREDAAASRQVRTALERNGYLCFTYIRGENTQPWANAVQVGTFFREAGVHLVIDSPAARQSLGVQLEALAYNYRNSSWRVPPSPPSASNTEYPCCKLCYYRGSVLIRCDPPQCGPQCVGAVP